MSEYCGELEDFNLIRGVICCKGIEVTGMVLRRGKEGLFFAVVGVFHNIHLFRWGDF